MTHVLNIRLILKVLGSLLIIESLFMILTTLVSLFYHEKDWYFFLDTSIITIALGSIGIFAGKKASKTLGRREGSIIVTSVWIIFSFIGMMPFWISGAIPSFTNAFFETISGFTTTGASILNDIEGLSHGMLFWRSLTHWIGGLGIVVISLALLPMFGFSGTQLFGAEASGPTKDKIHPKITGTAKRLWLIYSILTVSEILLLHLGGMHWFDSVCNSFGTIATGGFSTKQASIAYWDSAYIQYVIILFMMLSGVNFSLYYFLFKGKAKKLRDNEELKWFIGITFLFTIIITFSLIDFHHNINFTIVEKAFRDSLFQVSALITTTGFATADFMLWKPFVWVLLIILMLIGASAGSTSGAIKTVRVVIVFKYCYYEFKRMIHPKAVIPITYSKEIIRNDVVSKILAFVLMYLIILAIGVMILGATGMGFLESIGGMVTCMGGVGPGLGSIGPAGNFYAIPDISKWILAFVMLLGRLELFTVILLFTPVFWRK